MSMQIRDGAGAGYLAQVDVNNNLRVGAITRSQELAETELGNSYNLNTGDITFTGTTANQGVSYLKYTGENTLVITSFIWLIGTSTGGSGDVLLEIISDPTGGTLLSDANTATPVNRNFSSAKTLDATWYIASGENKTATGGTVAIQTRSSSGGRISIPVFAALSKGGELAMRYSPQSGNTSQKCMFAIAAYENTLLK